MSASGKRARDFKGPGNTNYELAADNYQWMVTIGSRKFPERHSGARLAFAGRGLIGAAEDDGGGGFVFELDFEYRMAIPMFMRFIMEPAGVGFGNDAVPLFGAHMFLGFDSQYIAFGLGAGLQLVEAYDNDDWVSREGYGTSIAFLVRVGSPSGFFVELVNAMTYVDRFRFGSLRVRAQWPLGHRSWMVLRGGGGITRIGYGELGFKRLVKGWSNERALFITATFGGAGIFSDVHNSVYAGPTFGFGFEAEL